MSSREPLLEPTFVARLGVYTALRANRKAEAGETTLIAKGEVEERQLDATGRYGRCDIRLNSHSGRKLVSGEVKRPEDTKGRDPRNESLVRDARLKAVARGLPFYFTCNMVEVVLFEVSEDASEHDREIGAFPLAPIRHSSEVDSFEARIDELSPAPMCAVAVGGVRGGTAPRQAPAGDPRNVAPKGRLALTM